MKESGTEKYGFAMLLGFWLLLLALLVWAFTDLLDRRDNPNRDPSSLDRGHYREVVLSSARGGHYIANGEINHHPVTFMVDTGATLISIPEPLARQLGLNKLQPMTARTANGTVQVYRTRLDSVRLGNIELRDVAASINPGMASGDKVLLGMSFLRQLELRHQNGELRIRQYR